MPFSEFSFLWFRHLYWIWIFLKCFLVEIVTCFVRDKLVVSFLFKLSYFNFTTWLLYFVQRFDKINNWHLPWILINFCSLVQNFYCVSSLVSFLLFVRGIFHRFLLSQLSSMEIDSFFWFGNFWFYLCANYGFQSSFSSGWGGYLCNVIRALKWSVFCFGFHCYLSLTLRRLWWGYHWKSARTRTFFNEIFVLFKSSPSFFLFLLMPSINFSNNSLQKLFVFCHVFSVRRVS